MGQKTMRTARFLQLAVFAIACMMAVGLAVPLQAHAADQVFADGEIAVIKVTAGTASYDEATNTLTLTNIKANDVYVNKPGTTIVLAGANTLRYQVETGADGISIAGSGSLAPMARTTNHLVTSIEGTTLTIRGGTLTGGVESGGNLVLAGGTITGEFEVGGNLTVSGATVKGPLEVGQDITVSKGSVTMQSGMFDKGLVESVQLRLWSRDGNLKISGGTVTVSNDRKDSSMMVACAGDLTVSGGKLDISDTYSGSSMFVSAGGNLTVSGGTFKLANAGGGELLLEGSKPQVKVTGGKLVLKNTQLGADRGNLNMTGGTLSVKCTGGDAIYGFKKATVTGGSFTAIGNKNGNAIEAASMNNKASCLKGVQGHLPKGAKFLLDGNEYQIQQENEVFLLNYGSKSTKATFGYSIKYGKSDYRIVGIGANAFNTKTGHKLKSIVFKDEDIYFIGKKAFYGTKALKKLSIGFCVEHKIKNDKLLDMRVSKSQKAKVAKNAFSKCGYKGGKGLTVAWCNATIGKADVKVHKKLLKSCGMSPQVKIKANSKKYTWLGLGWA
ncbi:MAG: hypothetical protein E7000_08695 [Coriobacteriaceae bacterium]|nr:hypothetical protein [Coriobacteriaceae bacterium]